MSDAELSLSKRIEILARALFAAGLRSYDRSDDNLPRLVAEGVLSNLRSHGVDLYKFVSADSQEAERLVEHTRKTAETIAAAEARGAALAIEQCRRLLGERISPLEATALAAEADRDFDRQDMFEAAAEQLRQSAASLPATPDLAAEVQRIEKRGAEVQKQRLVAWLRTWASGLTDDDLAQLKLYEAADLIEGGAE